MKFNLTNKQKTGAPKNDGFNIQPARLRGDLSSKQVFPILFLYSLGHCKDNPRLFLLGKKNHFNPSASDIVVLAQVASG